MPRVKLIPRLWGALRHDGTVAPGARWVIEAPDFCPYKHSTEVLGSMSADVVDPAICPLCKICTFVSEDAPAESELTSADRILFANYLIERNKKLAASIAGQITHLRKNDRLPIAMLLSAAAFKEMMDNHEFDPVRKQAIIACVVTQDVPIAYVAGCPVYYSRKLTRTPIQVVGEIDWK